MRSGNRSMLQDTPGILDRGSCPLHGKTISLELSRAQLEEAERVFSNYYWRRLEK